MAVLASDDFDRADAATLGANWGPIGTTDGQFGILSNQADTNDIGWSGSQYTTLSWPDNQYSQATLVGNPASLMGVCVRCDPSLAAATFYAAGHNVAEFAGANTLSRIYKYVSGAATSLGTGTTALSTGQVLRLEAEGTTLRMYINDILEIETTDSEISTGDAGITAFHSAGGFAVFDDWSGGNLLGQALVTGTVSSAATETDIVSGGKTLIVTLDGDTYVPIVSTQEISFVSSVLSANTTVAFSLTLPSTVANDILLLEYCHRSTTAGGMWGHISTGWTSFHVQLFSGLSTFSGRGYWHRASSDYFGLSTNVSSLINSAAAICTVYRGLCSTVIPVSASVSTIGEYNTLGNETQGEISTIIAGSMVCLTVVNSPDFAISGQSSVRTGSMTERAEKLNTSGTDTSITHASGLFNDTGTTGAFVWAQTNASSGSWAYALFPQTTEVFDSQRQNFINGLSSAQTEGTGWNAVVVTGQSVNGVVRTSDTVVTLTLDAFGSYDITAQETITVSVPAGILNSGNSLLATPTFTIDTAGGAVAQIFTRFGTRADGLGYGGIFPGNRVH